MKIAIVTEDGQSISQHFGRAPYYVVLEVEEGGVVKRELRDKMGHREFVGEEQGHPEGEPHGFGKQAGERHGRMAGAIADCSILLAGGMGRGAYQSLKEAGIKAIITDIVDVQEAVDRYLDGTIKDLSAERLH